MLDHYRFGIEEEYFISSQKTRKTLPNLPQAFSEDIRQALPQVLRSEMLQSQIEVATPPSQEFGTASELLAGYRRTLAAIADENALQIIAAGTHPLAKWDGQAANRKPRYDRMMQDLQMLGSRNILCGLHVHVSVPDPSMRVDMMRRIIPYLPVFLALSTSSPFWQARRTGLMGYRLAAYDELPRTGIPDLFVNEAEYRSYVEALVETRAIPDESYIWWAVRPSSKYPTLELRIADSCTRLEDTIAIAALYRCLVRHLAHNLTLNSQIGAAERAIALENKWIAQRHGIHGAFIDAASKTIRPLGDIVDAMIAMLEADAIALDCRDELNSLRSILTFGTSADAQIALESEARERGRTPTSALEEVVDWLANVTRSSRPSGLQHMH